MKRLSLVTAFVFLIGGLSSALAINPPEHTRLLHHHSLKNDEPNPIGEMVHGGGNFTSEGWQVTRGNGQIRITLNNFLPPEGTVAVTMTQLMPIIADDWVPFSLYSRGEGSFYGVNDSPGSFAMLKSDPNMVNNHGLDFKFIASPFNGEENRRDGQIPKRSWNSKTDYTFKIIWNKNRIWLTVNGDQLAELEFERQYETFGYIFLGTDNTYGSSMIGPVYKDLRIYAPATNYPFTNIADAYHEMAHAKIGGQSVAVADVDNNGEEDLYTSHFFNKGVDAENLLYVQNNQNFENQAPDRGVNDPSYSYQSLFGDFDKDNDKDLFVINYHSSSYPNNPNHLYQNDGNGYFSDVTDSYLTGNVARDSKGGTLIDIENDGDLDIVVVNGSSEHQVYVNDGSGRFAVESRGLDNFRSATNNYQSVTSGDINKDNYQDLVLVHNNGVEIALNDKNGSFIPGPTLNTGAGASSATLADIDNDADLDILVAMEADVGARIKIFRNNGGTSFTDISDLRVNNLSTFGLVPGDWDNDGDIDLFTIAKQGRGHIYMNDGSGEFWYKDDTGVEALFADGRGATTLDVNDDGNLDIYATARGAKLKDMPYSRNYLFRNDINSGNNYLKVKIVNEDDHTVGIGHKIYVYENGMLNDPDGLLGYREVLPVIGYKSQSSPVQHFGVESQSMVDVKVESPDGESKSYSGVSVNQTLIVRPVELVPESITQVFPPTPQTPVAGKPLTIQFKALSADDMPVAGQPITFDITAGDGDLDSTGNMTLTKMTDETGIASVEWTLSTTSGIDNSLTVSSLYEGFHLQGSPEVITVQTEPGDPYQLVKHAGDNQEGYVNGSLSSKIVAKVADEFGNGIPSQAVEFSILSGGGELSAAGTTAVQMTVPTDAEGLSKVVWNLGPQLGEQTLQTAATYNGVALQNSPATFTANANQPQRILSYVSGNYQTGSINKELDAPLTVRLRDMNENPVVDETIRFICVSGNANFSGSDTALTTTNNQGIAEAIPTLGETIGDTIYVFHAEADHAMNSPIVFKASATGGAPAKLQMVSGNSQTGQAGHVLANPFIVRVLDEFENPVKDYPVEFSVTQGSGSIQGEKIILIETDTQGLAKARFKLGQKAGDNTVVATAEGLEGSPVIFTAVGEAGPPARLTKVSGDGQTGNNGEPLSQPFKVSVTDSFFNIIPEHRVTFRVTGGGGSFSGQSQVTRVTDVWGQAAATLTLGPQAYEHQVTVTSTYNGQNLVGSPAVFTAYTGPGDPDRLEYVSGNNQIGRVNRQLPEPFKVRVVDENDLPFKGVPVQFITFSQGAHFDGPTDVTVETNDNGIASAQAYIGSNFGTNNYVFEAIAKYDGKNLKNSPIQFFASGRRSLAVSMQKVTNVDSLTDQVGQYLPDSLKIIVLDDAENPVSDHPVNFEVTTGHVLLNGKQTFKTANSNANGMSSVAVYMGEIPGDAVIKVSSDDGVDPLEPGDLNYYLTALPGKPDKDNSAIEAPTDIVADGQTRSNVNITLKDEFGNPLQDKNVSLQTAGIDVFVNQPESPTDAEGKANAWITSMNVGAVTVWVMVDDQPVVSTSIEFVPGPPHNVVPFGTDQSQEKENQLPEPIGVKVLDQWSHPVPGVNVNFEVTKGSGSIVEPQPVVTDTSGIAAVNWILGPELGEQKVKADIDGIIKDTYFVAYAVPPAEGIVSAVSGDSLIGLVNKQLPAPFVVSVTDTSGDPISKITVEFKIITGEGTFQTTNPVKTDAQGRASALLKAGGSPGLYKVRATAGTYGSITFSCIVQTERTILLKKLSGDGQTVRPFSKINLSIQAKDAFERLLFNEPLVFEITKGTGSIEESMPIHTGRGGTASVNWIVGKKGAQQVNVRASKAAVAQPANYTAIVVNSAPEFSPPIPRNIATQAGQTVNISVNAEDADGDSISYKAHNLPEGAEFNKFTHLFSWQPTTDQKGDHAVTFVVRDQFGAADSATTIITVDIVNQCPVIANREPAEDVITMFYDTPITFKVEASDPDGDQLTYSWLVDDVFGGDTPMLPLVFTKEQFPDSALVVEVIVSDDYCNQKERWHVHLRTPTGVELSNFQATSAGNSVELLWETSKEEHTAGFHVLKSQSESGEFTPVTGKLIEPDQECYRFKDTDVKAGNTYFYKVREIDVHGYTSDHGLVKVHIALPDELKLAQNYPNPFNPTTTIKVELPSAMKVRLDIFNTRGQIVCTLVDEEYAAGIHNLVWDAMDGQGQKAPSGIYYYRLKTERTTLVKKLLLLK